MEKEKWDKGLEGPGSRRDKCIRVAPPSAAACALGSGGCNGKCRIVNQSHPTQLREESSDEAPEKVEQADPPPLPLQR